MARTFDELFDKYHNKSAILKTTEEYTKAEGYRDFGHFYKAILEGDLEKVKTLCKKHKHFIDSTLHQHVREYGVEWELDVTNVITSPLCCAAAFNQTDIAEYLCKEGANTNARIDFRHGGEPLSDSGILSSGTNISLQSASALDFALKNKNIQLAKTLIQHKAYYDPYKLAEFSRQQNNDELIKTAYKCAQNETTASICRLEDACHDFPCIQQLLKTSGNANSMIGCYSHLNLAINKNLPNAAKLLINSGADVNLANSYPPLHYAASHAVENKDFIDVIDLLKDKGADFNYRDQDGHSALYHAVKQLNRYNPQPCLNVVKKLAEYGADWSPEDIKAIKRMDFLRENKEVRKSFLDVVSKAREKREQDRISKIKRRVLSKAAAKNVSLDKDVVNPKQSMFNKMLIKNELKNAYKQERI